MNAKDYLRQAYYLDVRIKSDLDELSELKRMAYNLFSPSFEPNYNASHPTEAPFVRGLERVVEMEEKINSEIDRLVELKEQIRSVIDAVEDSAEQLVLRYRYLHNYKWEQIGDILYADESTIRRWHRRALQHVRVPDDYIRI